MKTPRRKPLKKRDTPKKKNRDNPRHVECDGILFDSKLETYCYQALVKAKISFVYEPTSFIIQIPFTYSSDVYEPDKKRGDLLSKRTEKYQSIKYTPDFVGKDWIIEVKGMQNERFKIVWKLFKKYLTDKNIKYDLYLPKNQKQVDQCIELIHKSHEIKIGNN